jgi:hypothetical protein
MPLGQPLGLTQCIDFTLQMMHTNPPTLISLKICPHPLGWRQKTLPPAAEPFFSEIDAAMRIQK